MRHSPTTTRLDHRRKAGIVSVWTAVTIISLIGFGGLATDSGYVLLTGHQLQKAADSAALAAAAQVQFSTSDAISAAVACAAKNSAAGAPVELSSGTDVQCGNYSLSAGTFTANATPYNAVCVT